MSDEIIIIDQLPERYEFTDPLLYNGKSTYELYLLHTTDDPVLSVSEWLAQIKGSTPVTGENNNWWIDGVDTGLNAVAPTDEHVQSLITGYSEPKKGTDDHYVTALQIASIATISDKVDKAEGYSLVLNTEIAKIHTRNTDSTLLSEDGTKSVYLDNAGVFHVRSISQSGSTYETHAEQVFTTKNEIILRDGAIAGLGAGEYVGFRAKLYDGANDGLLVYDKDGFARVGDAGSLAKIATIQETPTNNQFTYYDNATYGLKTRALALTDLPNGLVLLDQSAPQTIGTTGSRLSKLWATDLDSITLSFNDTKITRNAASLLQVQKISDNTLAGLKLSTLYANKIVPNADSTTALQIMKADGTTPVLTVDTTNGRIGVNKTPSELFDLTTTNQSAALNFSTNHASGYSILGLQNTNSAEVRQWFLIAYGKNSSAVDRLDFLCIRTGIKPLQLIDNGNVSIYGSLSINNGQTITFGANDSAGAGFRLVKVPNI